MPVLKGRFRVQERIISGNHHNHTLISGESHDNDNLGAGGGVEGNLILTNQNINYSSTEYVQN